MTYDAVRKFVNSIFTVTYKNGQAESATACRAGWNIEEFFNIDPGQPGRMEPGCYLKSQYPLWQTLYGAHCSGADSPNETETPP